MNKSLLFFLLFLLAFLVVPLGVAQFEDPKVIAAEAGIILLFLNSAWHDQLSLKGRLLQLSLSGIIIFLTVIQLFFLRTPISFFGNIFRLQGIFLLWLLLLFSYLSSYVELKNIPGWVAGLLITAQLFMTLFLPVNDSGRFVGSLGEPNASAAFLLFLWPFLLKNDSHKIRVLLGSLAVVVGIVFLFKSRSGLLGFTLQAAFWALLKLRFSLKKALVICLLLLTAAFALPFMQKNILYENRGDVWKAGFYAGLKNPVMGGGFGNTELLLHRAAVELNLPLQYSYVDSSHNIWLDWWVQGGLIGFGVLAAFIFQSGKKFTTHNNSLLPLLFLGSLTTLSFNPQSVVGLLQFWWLIGQ